MRRIGITNPIFITPVSTFISCILVFVGCSPFGGYIALDAGSGLLQPTFRMYRDPYFQESVGRIGSITVSKRLRSFEEPEQWPPSWDDSQTVWALEYKPSDSLPDELLRRLLRLSRPVSRLTYGKVPPSYTETVKAVPLETGQSYFVEIWAYAGLAAFHGTLEFTIHSNDIGIPIRLEYSLPDDIFERTRDDLRLD